MSRKHAGRPTLGYRAGYVLGIALIVMAVLVLVLGLAYIAGEVLGFGAEQAAAAITEGGTR